MRVALIGCVRFSRRCLQTVAAHEGAELVGVVTSPEAAAEGDHCSLVAAAAALDVPALAVGQRDFDDMAAFLAGLRPDLVLCMGWHALLPERVLSIPPLGVLGFHPSELPHNRGRHPIIWALALGLERTASSFILLDRGADTGDLVDQVYVDIGDDDDAGSLYDRITEIAQGQLEDLLVRLPKGEVRRIPQDVRDGNAWRRRTAEDGRIDWRMSARSIRNLVRALAPPYPCAHVETRGGPVLVRRCEAGPEGPANVEPGRVLAVTDEGIRVQTGEGTVWLVDHAFDSLPAVGSCL